MVVQSWHARQKGNGFDADTFPQQPQSQLTVHETSYDCRITRNVVTGNGFGFPQNDGGSQGAGILISNSPNTEVDHNTVSGNYNGIMGREDDRGSGTYGPYHVANLSVHDNVVTQTGGTAERGRAAGITDGDPTADPYAAAANNVWTNNSYMCDGTTKWRWFPNADVSKGAWLSVPQDAGSTFSGC